VVALEVLVVQVLLAAQHSHVVQLANSVYLVKPLAVRHQIRFALESSVALRVPRDVEALLDVALLDKLLVEPDVVLPHRSAYLVNVSPNARVRKADVETVVVMVHFYNAVKVIIVPGFVDRVAK
jgi:hypothetical protein